MTIGRRSQEASSFVNAIGLNQAIGVKEAGAQYARIDVSSQGRTGTRCVWCQRTGAQPAREETATCGVAADNAHADAATQPPVGTVESAVGETESGAQIHHRAAADANRNGLSQIDNVIIWSGSAIVET